jgi:hypothetical protein
MYYILSFTAKLEQSQLGLNQTINELSQNLKEQGATFRAQVSLGEATFGEKANEGRQFHGTSMEGKATFRAQVWRRGEATFRAPIR